VKIEERTTSAQIFLIISSLFLMTYLYPTFLLVVMRSACTSTDPVSLYATPVTRPDSMRTTCWLSTKYRSQHGMCPAMGVYHPPTYHLSPPTRALESTPLTHRHHRKHTQTPTQASTYWTPSATQKQLTTGASAWRGITRSYEKTESRLWSKKTC